MALPGMGATQVAVAKLIGYDDMRCRGLKWFRHGNYPIFFRTVFTAVGNMDEMNLNKAEMTAAKSLEAIDSIQRPDLVTLITNSIRQRVLDGRYTAGHVLPAEAELAKAFAVSRNVMREALRQLRVMGLVEVTQGRPPRISDISTKASINALSTLLARCEGTLEHLMQTRIPLEIQVVTLLATAEETPDLTSAAQANRDMIESSSYEAWSDADQAFHRCLAKATGNQLLATVVETVTGLTFTLRDRALSLAGFPDWPYAAPHPAGTTTEHDEVLEAVKRRDQETARNIMLQHMENVVSVFRRLEDACRKRTGPAGNETR